MKKIVLASRSNRRISLMSYITHNFRVMPSKIDETIENPDLPIEEIVMKLAIKKAERVKLRCEDDLIVSAHTLVVIGDEKYGKPVDDADAVRMLQNLQGKRHQVVTGVYICEKDQSLSFICETEVEMAPMSEEEIEYYVNTGEGYERSGGYAAQGLGSRYISTIKGDFFNMLGLPVHKLYVALKKFGLEL